MFSRQVIRRITTSAIRRSGDDHGGYFGANLPFKTNNRFRLTLLTTLFLSSGFSLPFFLVRHQLLKD